MLTGFNTDIRYAERVYHVQTEDRGLGNPVVESLVYVGGEILLSKKSAYAQHVHGDKVDEKAVRELMDIQHRRIIEAIRRGRLDAKKPDEGALDLGDEATPALPAVSAAAVAAVAAILSVPSEPLPGDTRAPSPRPKTPEKPAAATKPARPASPAAPRPSAPPAATRARAEEGEFVETEVTPRPAPAASPSAAVVAPRPALSDTVPPFPSAIQPAVRVPAAPTTAPSPGAAAPAAPEPGPRKPPGSTSGPKTLDQVIIEYLASEAASERLDLSVMAGGEFVSGETVALTVIATTSLGHKPVTGAQITIRVISTAGPSQVLFRGVTGNDGMVKTSCALPDIGNGNAALVVAAFSSMGTSEAKYLIARKPK